MTVKNPPSWLQTGHHPAINDRMIIDSLISTPGVSGLLCMGVSQDTSLGMTVSVAAGECFIPGSDFANQGYYHVINDSTITVPITAAPDPANPRMDLIIVRVQDSSTFGTVDLATIETVTGVPSSSPSAPPMPPNSYLLAEVVVPNTAGVAAAGGILQSMITQKWVRAAALGGITSCRDGSEYPSSPYGGQMVWDRSLQVLQYWNDAINEWDSELYLAYAYTNASTTGWVNAVNSARTDLIGHADTGDTNVANKLRSGHAVVTTTSGGAASFSFSPAFSAVPHVVPNLRAPIGGLVNGRAGLTTTTSFQVLAYSSSGSVIPSGLIEVDWIAHLP